MVVSQNGASVGMSKTARRHGALASGTALAAFVAAGMFSPISVEQAQAACSILVAGTNFQCAGTSDPAVEIPNPAVTTTDGWQYNIDPNTTPPTVLSSGVKIDNTGDYDGTFTQDADTTINADPGTWGVHIDGDDNGDSIVTVNVDGQMNTDNIGVDLLYGNDYNVNVGKTGDINADNQGMWIWAAGTVTVVNDGSVSGADQGIRIDYGAWTPGSGGPVNVINNGTIESANGDGVLINTNGAVKVVNTSDNSILAGADGVDITTNDTIDVANVGTIGSSGDPVGANGILVNSTASSVKISDLYEDTDPDLVGGIIYADLDGINATAVTGIDIDLSHGQNADPAEPSKIFAGQDGIIANNTGTGNVSVKTGQITAVDDGVIATATDGNSYVEVTDNLVADGFFGAAAYATGGDATVMVNDTIAGSTPGAGPGIAAFTQVTGAGVATTDVNQNVQATLTGAQAFQFGDGGAARVGVYNDGENTNGSIDSAGVGVFAWKTGNGVDVPDDGTDAVLGIDVYVDGPISGAAAGTADRTSGPGIWAVWGDNLFGGAGPISGSGDGDMWVSTGVNGTVASEVNAFHVVRNGGNGEVFVGVGADVDAGLDGVYIYRTRTGSDEGSETNVNVGRDTLDGVAAANIDAERDGIRIDAPFALHTVNVNIKGDEDEQSTVTAANSAVRINTFSVFGNNEVNLNNDGGLKGAGTGKNSTVVIGTDGTVHINNNAGATIETAAGNGGRALDVDAGETIRVNNDGSLHGNVRLVAQGEDDDGNSVIINNTASDSWDYSGFNYIEGPGNLIVNNEIDGVATAGPSSFTFFNSTNGNVSMNNDGVFNADGFNGFLFWETPGGAAGDGTSAFNNRGTLNVSGFLDFNGLDDFNNEGGLVDMGNNDVAGDLIVIRDAFDDAGHYNASGDARLAIDAELSPGGSADVLAVRGDVNGETLLLVDDLDEALPGQYDPNGVLFARVGGNTQVGDFVTDGGIDKGLFRYDAYLRNEPVVSGGFEYQSQWVLASTLDAEAYEFPVATYGAQNLWHASTGVWLDRTADLRSAFGETTMPSIDLKNEGATVSAPGNVTPGVWGRVFGGTLERDIDNTSYAPDGLEGPEHRYSGHFNQDYYGFMAGVDFGKEDIGANGQNVAWLFGVFGGYTGSKLDFSNTQTEFDYSQGSIGGYVTYLNGGFFVDTAVKADFGNMDYSTQMGGKDSADYTSIGVIVDTGYRFNGSSGWFVEPKATLAYVNTSFDDMTVLGTGVSFSDGDSLRGRLGARVGTSIVNNGNVIEPYLEASVWNEFDGDNSATLASNGFNVPVTYDAGGVYGEVVLGANIINVGNGWNAFGKGAVQFGDDSLLGFSGNLGFRKNW